MPDLPDDLRTALATRLADVPVERLRVRVARLIEAYRSGATPTAPILGDAADVAAYAAYRMPATYAAVSAVLGELRHAVPEFAPVRHLDIGGGTGAACWAVVALFDGVREITVVDQVAEALAVGRRLAEGSVSTVLRNASWVSGRLEDATALPTADLVTVSYVLGELSPDRQADLVDRVASAAGVLVLVEPGTPAGYRRILDARTRLIDAGRVIVAPCPHQGTCPLESGDWCHFGTRVNRSALHRRLKDGDLGYEDEKFAYLIAARSEVAQSLAATTGSGRILRRPTQRKGMVTLRLCQSNGTAADHIVTKRHGDSYRSARDATWGDTWGDTWPAGPTPPPHAAN